MYGVVQMFWDDPVRDEVPNSGNNYATRYPAIPAGATFIPGFALFYGLPEGSAVPNAGQSGVGRPVAITDHMPITSRLTLK
jgi:hypothetical protein